MKMTQIIWSGLISSASQRSITSHSRRVRYVGFSLVMTFLLVSFSACSNLFEGVSQMGDTPSKSATGFMGGQTTPTPDPLQVAKARAMQIMAGMSLEQKLGQLIVVEYLGNSYQDSGLQYMVNQQYV